jgi:DNA-binding transcriptional LysR family regulator
MDELGRIRTFINVVKAGSFSAAARHLSSVSSVVRQVNSLEEELGVRLLNRSTRSLSLTEAGRLFYDRVTVLSDSLSNITSEVRSINEEIKGPLKVSLRVAAGTTIITPNLPKFFSRYPDLSLDIILTDERRDITSEGIDVAMWMGDLGDSTLIARRLSPTRRIVCASPTYLSKHGVPRTPQDLLKHNCLLFTAPSYSGRWSFSRDDGDIEELEVRGSVRSDNGLVLLGSALSGVGIAIAHEWMMRSFIQQGFMTRILDDYTVNPRPGDADLYAVYPSTRRHSRKVKAFVDFLVDTFATDERS